MIDVSGHTVGHVAFHFPESRVVFTADSLMALGCGRVFEGTAEMMHASLARLAALPPDTLVCSGHEYTANNAKFALTVDPGNAALISRQAAVATARSDGRPTVPSTCKTNWTPTPSCAQGIRRSGPGLEWKMPPTPRSSPRSAPARTRSDRRPSSPGPGCTKSGHHATRAVALEKLKRNALNCAVKNRTLTV